ncbi:hypothetical protein [Paenibacillus sp. OSY-SE]|uniref:hypothetical protein n=1 Tax=Paenibacillus sp. OSY-SE TaxID=1196323 RepID=UPI0002D768E1|nr:hypothetical protein [Paenibacillus sp. OSY-SE]
MSKIQINPSLSGCKMCKHSITVILLLLIISLLSGCALGNKSEAQSSHPMISSSPIQYAIEATWNEQTHTIHASANVTFRNAHDRSLQELVFHWFADSYRKPELQPIQYQQRNEQLLLERQHNAIGDNDVFFGGVTMKKVTTGEGKRLDYTHANQALTVKLGKALAPGATTSIRIEYEVLVPYGAQRLSYTEQYAGGTYWTPQLAVYDPIRQAWNRVPNYPGYKSDFFYAADYDVQLNVPAAWTLITNGTQVGRTVEQNRQIVHTQAYSIRQFVFYASPDYQETKHALTGGGTLSLYTFKQRQSSVGEQEKWLSTVEDAISFYNVKLGKLPVKHWKMVEAPYPEMNEGLDGIILFGKLGDSQTDSDATDALVTDDTLRSIAKQWFSSSIGNNAVTDAFLEEGLSEFAVQYFRHESQGAPWKQVSPTDLPAQPVTTSSIYLDEGALELYRVKGAAVMTEWVRQTGTEALDTVWQLYFTRYEGKMASVGGYVNVIGHALGQMEKAAMQQLLSGTASDDDPGSSAIEEGQQS